MPVVCSEKVENNALHRSWERIQSTTRINIILLTKVTVVHMDV